MDYLEMATRMASAKVPQRYLRTCLAQSQEWDASKEVYVTVERPSQHINGMCQWLRDRAAADSRDAAVNKFNPSFRTAKLGAREAAKEDAGLWGFGATGFDAGKIKPIDDSDELLAALYELRDLQAALEQDQIAALKNARPAQEAELVDPWAKARAAKKAAKAAKKGIPC